MTTGEPRQGGLPAETTRLVGRGDELALVRRLCERSRLVTVTGVGGVGKTRVALRAAAELEPRFNDGAWLVELSALKEGTSLPYAIAKTLRLDDQSVNPMIDVVADYLSGRELLLVLDTCEHLVDACAFTVRALLGVAPGLRIMTTSRRPLGLIFEDVVTVDPLPVPDAGTASPDAATEDAVTLLAERAAEAVPDFRMTRGNRADLVRLCRRLDGLPLAIELAAARLRELPVRELTHRLEQRFPVLEDTQDGMPEAEPPWHRALRTAIGWSHELCGPLERLLWARLSVFAGSFDVEAARRVCGDAVLPSEKIPALLGTLADGSILTWVPTSGGERYRMLDTIREYGEFWLRDLGEQDELRRRHRDHYLELARRGDSAWLGPDQFQWYDRMTAEYDNLRAALEFCLATPEGNTALELAGALWFFWYACGFNKEGQHYLERALELDRTPSRARNQALWACGLVMVNQGDGIAAAAWGAECAGAAERLGDARAAEHARTLTMIAAAVRGDLKGMVALSESLIAARDSTTEISLSTLLPLLIRGMAAINEGNNEDAITVLERLRAECDRHGESWMRAFGDVFRAQAELARGWPGAARVYAQVALEVKRRMHDSVGMAMAVDVLGPAAMAAGQGERAARMLGLAQQIWGTLGPAQAGVPEWVTIREACEKQARALIGDDAFEAAFHEGFRNDLDTGIADALGRPTGS